MLCLGYGLVYVNAVEQIIFLRFVDTRSSPLPVQDERVVAHSKCALRVRAPLFLGGAE